MDDKIQELFERSGPIEELEFTEDFLAHLKERGSYTKHQVSASEVLEVHQAKPRYFRNIASGRAPVIMVGPTKGLRWLCVPIEPTGRFGIWRPVTAFEANQHHVDRYLEALNDGPTTK